MDNNKKKTGKSVLIVIGTLFALFIVVILIAVFGSGSGKADHGVQSIRSRIENALPFLDSGKVKEVSFFMENDRGTYNLVELSIPADGGQVNGAPKDGGGQGDAVLRNNDEQGKEKDPAGGEQKEDKFPVVLMAHGFAGTLHSGGASELGARLAEKGVLAARIDFDPYVEPDRSAARTHIYPLSQMEDDAVKLLGILVDEYGGDRDDISLYGRSYGGRLMMRMANESAGGFDYKKLALVAPAGDAVAFERYLGGKEKYDEMKKEAEAAEEKAGAHAENSSVDKAGEKADNAGAAADGSGYPEKLGICITPQWFKDVESYDPTEYGWKFGEKPVILFYNTLDTVVYPDTSIRCAEAYENHEIVVVTTDDGHGYEMGYKKSELKDDIMDRLVEFLTE